MCVCVCGGNGGRGLGVGKGEFRRGVGLRVRERASISAFGGYVGVCGRGGVGPMEMLTILASGWGYG